MEQPNLKKEPFRKKQLNDYGRYAGLGIQMMGAILVLTWLGNWSDKYLGFHYPVLTLTGAILGIAAAMYWLFTSLPKR
jgi:membrane-associated phospholipid phosphatase